MTSRERLLVALGGGEPDRVPRALGCYHLDLRRMAPRDLYRDDLVDIHFVRLKPSREEVELGRRAMPHDGDTRLGNPAQLAPYSQWSYFPNDDARRNPLAEAKAIEDLKRFRFPDVSMPYQVKGLAKQVRSLHERCLAAGGNLPHLGGELFEAAWRLRGLENFLIDLVRRPDWADFILDRLADLALRNAQALASAGVDLLALDDDVGMPGTMMISPETWREFFKPRLAAIIEGARSIQPDLRVLYHSDGTFTPIVGDLIEIGVDAINPLQPEHMPAEPIRASFGSRVALWGAVGRQTTFSFDGPEEIREEVRERIRTLGRSGLILCPAYDIDEPDIPWANVQAFLESVETYGRNEE